MDSPAYNFGPLTPEEETYLRENFRTLSYPIIAHHLNRDPHRLACLAWRKGLRRTPEEQKAIMLKFSSSLFKPGNRPVTADKYKGCRLSPATEFKKGQLPHNTLHDNAITIRTDRRGVQYKWIRLSLGVWKQLHLHLWENEVGPVPAGHVVAFKTKDTLRVELDNLHCVPRGTQQTGRPRKKLQVKDVTEAWRARNATSQEQATPAPKVVRAVGPIKLSPEVRVERLIATNKARIEAREERRRRAENRAAEKKLARQLAAEQRAAEAETRKAQARVEREQAKAQKEQEKAQKEQEKALEKEEKAARKLRQRALAQRTKEELLARRAREKELIRERAEKEKARAQSRNELQELLATENAEIKSPKKKKKKAIIRILDTGEKAFVEDLETRRLVKKITTSRKAKQKQGPKQERKSLVEKLRAMSYQERQDYFRQKTKGLVPVWLDAKTCVYRHPSKV